MARCGHSKTLASTEPGLALPVPLLTFSGGSGIIACILCSPGLSPQRRCSPDTAPWHCLQALVQPGHHTQASQPGIVVPQHCTLASVHPGIGAAPWHCTPAWVQLSAACPQELLPVVECLSWPQGLAGTGRGAFPQVGLLGSQQGTVVTLPASGCKSPSVTVSPCRALGRRDSSTTCAQREGTRASWGTGRVPVSQAGVG